MMERPAADDEFRSPDEVHPVRANGRFYNPWPASAPAGFRDFLRWQVGRRARQEIVTGPAWPRFERAVPAFVPRGAAGALAITWVGHSTVLLQIGSVNLLTDPIWSDRASPVRFAGPRRMVPPGVAIESLPPIDVVLLSHNHYDHLDDRTVRMLIERHPAARWIAPVGVADFALRRGAAAVDELTWWEERHVASVRIACTPAQHFSARGLGDRNRTLWCGYAIHGSEGSERRVFFAGDTARHPAFRSIAERYGPFELTMMPIGAYEPRWFMRSVHMNPEEAVRAHVELTAGGSSRAAMVPIHWGTFRLTDEPPAEPPARTRAAWAAAGLRAEDLWLLRHGETHVRAP